MDGTRVDEKVLEALRRKAEHAQRQRDFKKKQTSPSAEQIVGFQSMVGSRVTVEIDDVPTSIEVGEYHPDGGGGYFTIVGALHLRRMAAGKLSALLIEIKKPKSDLSEKDDN